MPSKKRHLEEDGSAVDGHVHASRKRRLQYGEADANMAKIFNDLRDELPSVRTAATSHLLKALLADPSDRASRIDTALTRLIKGTCSGAKAARLGFSMALAEVLRLAFNRNVVVDGPARSIGDLVQKIFNLSIPEGKASGGERRDYLLGRCFALQAVLQSGILQGAPKQDVRAVFDAIADLAAQKPWLRTECGAVLKKYLDDEPGDETAGAMIESWAAKSLLKSPEGVAIWLVIKKKHPQMRLPKGYWHHNNPLAPQERAGLTKILLRNSVDSDNDANGTSKMSGARQSTPSFAWNAIFNYLWNDDDFTSFWTDCIALPMFSASSSTERKALGLQLVSQALKQAPRQELESILHPNIIRCIIDQRAKSDRLLFEAAKQPLDQMLFRARADPVAAASLVCKLLIWVPGSLDKVTKSTVETMLGAVDPRNLSEVIATLELLIQNPEIADQKEADAKRRLVADLFLQTVRARRSNPATLIDATDDAKSGNPALQPWLMLLVRIMSAAAFAQSEASASPPLSQSIQSTFQDRLMSVLGDLLGSSVEPAVLAMNVVTDVLYSFRERLVTPLKDEDLKLVRKALKLQQPNAVQRKGRKRLAHAYQLLLALGIIQVYRHEPDSVSMLEDIVEHCRNGQQSVDASTNLVELLLGFISRQSALYRKLAEQVFDALAPEISSEGIQSLIDILSQKENLAGQQALFAQEEEVREVVDVEEDEDAEEFSDVELLNGDVLNSSPESGSTDESDEEDSTSESEDEDSESTTSHEEGDRDEDEEIERNLAKALGPAGLRDESDTDGSDMDDDQMLEVDKALVTVLTEHKKLASKKKDKKDAKENIVNFKNRVLDLLAIYMRSQYADSTALDVIHPLAMLTRTTSNPPTAKKALDVLEQYFGACKRHKSLPRVEDVEACFALLNAVHEEMRLGDSKLHASACSKASLFLAKILVSMNPENWERVAIMYVTLQKEWRTEARSKIHISIFNDWHSWSLAR